MPPWIDPDFVDFGHPGMGMPFRGNEDYFHIHPDDFAPDDFPNVPFPPHPILLTSRPVPPPIAVPVPPPVLLPLPNIQPLPAALPTERKPNSNLSNSNNTLPPPQTRPLAVQITGCSGFADLNDIFLLLPPERTPSTLGICYRGIFHSWLLIYLQNVQRWIATSTYEYASRQCGYAAGSSGNHMSPSSPTVWHEWDFNKNSWQTSSLKCTECTGEAIVKATLQLKTQRDDAMEKIRTQQDKLVEFLGARARWEADMLKERDDALKTGRQLEGELKHFKIQSNKEEILRQQLKSKDDVIQDREKSITRLQEEIKTFKIHSDREELINQNKKLQEQIQELKHRLNSKDSIISKKEKCIAKMVDTMQKYQMESQSLEKLSPRDGEVPTHSETYSSQLD